MGNTFLSPVNEKLILSLKHIRALALVTFALLLENKNPRGPVANAEYQLLELGLW